MTLQSLIYKKASKDFRTILDSTHEGSILVEGKSQERMKRMVLDNIARDEGTTECIEIGAEDENVSIEAARDLKRSIAKKSLGKRYVIVSYAHNMQEAAANALLKMVEEPPLNTVFILISEPYGAISTIRSRCAIVKVLCMNEKARKGATPDGQIASIIQNCESAENTETKKIVRMFIVGSYDELRKGDVATQKQKVEILASAMSLYEKSYPTKLEIENIMIRWKNAI